MSIHGLWRFHCRLCTSKIDKFLERLLVRLIEYYPIKDNREDIDVLFLMYNIEPLKIRWKRNLIKLMHDQSKDIENVHLKHCNIKLRSSNKIKMKS